MEHLDIKRRVWHVAGIVALSVAWMASGCTSLAPSSPVSQNSRSATVVLGPGAPDTPPADPLAHLLGPAPVAADAPAVNAALLEQAIHAQINAVREEHGLPRLGWSDTLRPVAAAHSLDMATHRFFDHTNQRGETPTERGRRAGLGLPEACGDVVVEGLGENLFLTHRFAEYRVLHTAEGDVFEFDWKTIETIAAQAVEAWMQSYTHRLNVLSPIYTHHAIGVALGDNQTVFITQNLLYQPAHRS